MSIAASRPVAVAALLVAAGMLPAGAGAADEVSGVFQCNAERIPIRGAVARWEPATRTLALLFFKDPPSAETVRHWAEQSSGTSGMIPQGMGYVARLTYTLKAGAAGGDQGAIESYHFYIDCPTLQMNVNRSTFTRRDMRADFPEFSATLKPGGRLKATLRGAEEMGRSMDRPTKATWDVRVDTAIHAR